MIKQFFLGSFLEEIRFVFSHMSYLPMEDLANTNGPAIWDSRCTYHATIPDYRGYRDGRCVSGVGEVPYLDPHSVCREEGLAMTTKGEKEKGRTGRQIGILNGWYTN